MPIKAYFESSLALAYAVPASALEPLLPPGLVVDTYKGFGFLAIVLVHTRDLRPAFLPSGIGISFYLSGYRIFVKYETTAGQTLRGLRIIRTDTNRRSMRFLGNLLTHYSYELSQWTVRRTERTFEAQVKTKDGVADLHVEADLGADQVSLPAGSPFDHFDEARKFAAPLPFTFDYEKETHSIIRVQGVRGQWNPRPVPVTVHKCAFLRQPAFSAAVPVLANAFFVERVPYAWRHGIRERLS
jgi:hypothetical protein